MCMGIVEAKMTPIHPQIVGLLFPFTTQLQQWKYGYGNIEKQMKTWRLLLSKLLLHEGAQNSMRMGEGELSMLLMIERVSTWMGMGEEMKGMGA